MSTERFSAEEAVRLLGKTVVCCETGAGLLAGTPGRVVRVRGKGGAGIGFSVAVQWHSPCGQKAGEFTKAEFERNWTISQSAE